MDPNLICTTKHYYMIYFFELRTTIILLIPGDVSKHSLLHSKLAQLTLALTPSSASMHHRGSTFGPASTTNNYSTYLMWVVKSQIRWNRKVYLHYYWEKCLLVFGCHRITEDIQCLIYHYGFILQNLQKDAAVQGWTTKLLKGIWSQRNPHWHGGDLSGQKSKSNSWHAAFLTQFSMSYMRNFDVV